jgi:hypothetical protein
MAFGCSVTDKSAANESGCAGDEEGGVHALHALGNGGRCVK